MQFSNPKNSKKFKVKIESVRMTDKGGLRLKALDAEHPNDEPGYMVFTSKEVARIMKVLQKNQSD